MTSGYHDLWNAHMVAAAHVSPFAALARAMRGVEAGFVRMGRALADVFAPFAALTADRETDR